MVSKPPDSSVPMPELFLREGKDHPVASGDSDLIPNLGENALVRTPDLHLSCF